MYVLSLDLQSSKLQVILLNFAKNFYRSHANDIFKDESKPSFTPFFSFAHRYVNSPSDAVAMLADALITLSLTRKKPSKPAFVKSCGSMNGGVDFPSDVLEDMYNRIITESINVVR